MVSNNFQRSGARSNAEVGRDFEELVAKLLEKKIGIPLSFGHEVNVGVGNRKKPHEFDLGSDSPPVIVECKSHTWTGSGNVPSAKIQNWSEAMLYFLLAPKKYRKIFVIQKSVRGGNSETLGAYYLRNRYHLIPNDVEFWECDVETKKMIQLTKFR